MSTETKYIRIGTQGRALAAARRRGRRRQARKQNGSQAARPSFQALSVRSRVVHVVDHDHDLLPHRAISDNLARGRLLGGESACRRSSAELNHGKISTKSRRNLGACRNELEEGDAAKSDCAITVDYADVQTRVMEKYDIWHKDLLGFFCTSVMDKTAAWDKKVSEAKEKLENWSIETGDTMQAIEFLNAAKK